VFISTLAYKMLDSMPAVIGKAAFCIGTKSRWLSPVTLLP